MKAPQSKNSFAKFTAQRLQIFIIRTLGILLCVLLSLKPLAAWSAEKPIPLAELPTTEVNNRLVVSVQVSHYALNLVVDTGATKTALFQSQEYDFHDLEKTGPATILFPALDEQVEGDRLAPIPFHFGPYSYQPGAALLVRKRPPIGDRLNFKFDGVLGQDFFIDHVVEVDPKLRTIKLYPPGTDLRKHFLLRQRLKFKGTAPHIQFKHQLPWEHRPTTKSMLLDTGFPGIMIIWNERQFSMAAGQGKVAEYKAQNKGIFTRATFKINRLRFHHAPIFLAPKVPKQAHERDGLLGANVLNQFNYAIDFRRKQLLLGGSRLRFDRIDGHFYVPNNETFEYKRFNAFDANAKMIIE